MEEINFELSGLEDGDGDLVNHYEIEFSKRISAAWLQRVIKWALLLDSIGYDIYDLANESMREARAKFRILSR